MTVDELRQAFLEFFEARDHRRIPSSSLVPHGDPTLLFTTAGMVQFKPYFMGLEDPPAPRLTSIQRCFRTTDIEEVGDESHLTLFEMLGNFSVGDYFKPEAVEWAWEFLTGVLKIDPDRLWATVYTDDDDAFELWRQKGIPEARILRYTAEQGNYWGPPGDSGPCGPCSELHYDFGEPTEPRAPDYDYDADHPALESGRFLEIWNLVFMTYYQQEDGTRELLPAANIDTGAGLERLASVLQGVRTVHETDELRAVIAAAEAVSGRTYDPLENPAATEALRAVSEHSRAIAFLVTDGVLPSNDGRGYVLRRVLRRAVYFGYQHLGLREPFLGRVVSAAIDNSVRANPELEEQRAFVVRVAEVEEARFQQTLARGLELLDAVLAREAAAKRVPGRDMFTLYDTHGLPPELTREVAASHGYAVDEAAFEAEMAAQRERSRGDETFAAVADQRAARYAALGVESQFVGYEGLEASSTVTLLMRDGTTVDRLESGDAGELVLAASSFYPEGGGQIGDRGEVITPSGRFRVEDTHRFGDAIVHIGSVSEGAIATAESAESRVDPEFRLGSMRNHTATHLLHASLREHLGTHVRQAGSYVGPDRLRFDYTHPESPTREQLRSIQRLVNQKVREDIQRETLVLPYDQAVQRGAIAFFEDKYTDQVRVVEYCEVHGHGQQHSPQCFSREFCGGTHLHSTGQIGRLQIVSDSSIGAGLRRIEAVTGPEADEYVEQRLDQIDALAQRFKVPATEVDARVATLEDQLASERHRADQAAQQASAGRADDLVDAAETIGGVQVLIARVEVDSADSLRPMVDRLRQRLGSAFITLAAEIDGRPMFVAAATDDVVARGLRADEVVRTAAQLTGGGGGGRPQLAQAGGRDMARMDDALESARIAARERLGG
ncbi:MAG: alanine--tRNA ligase [Chloroflexi bacterium]|nr:alanine--tRNA ligase [Chloroflexota bacterium]MDA1146483.1 alanine--tRNA ligase [Chloroflexota bacterium]PKB56655.1 MAG: alanine--tRNA ligase [SAR202 cluster bacterium Casp-Chloro-G1]